MISFHALLEICAQK